MVFERYTERARRVIFFARYEASVFASSVIDTEHLLLGLVREGGGPADGILRRFGVTHSEVTNHLRTRSPGGTALPTSVDIPLSPSARRTLEIAGEEADGMRSEHVDTDHLLLGLLQQRSEFAAEFLSSKGMRVGEVREELRLRAQAKVAPSPKAGPFSRLSNLLRRLDECRARYHVAAFGQDAIRVEVAVPEQRWIVTLFADGRVAVETYAAAGGVADETLLEQLLDRLGPPRQADR